MTQICQVCNHSERLEIDRALIQGRSLTNISKKYSVHINAVLNHRDNHVSRQLAKAWEMKQTELDFDLLNRIDKIIHKAEIIFDRNFEAN